MIFADDGNFSRRSSSQNILELKGGNHATLDTILNIPQDTLQPIENELKESTKEENEIQTEVCSTEVPKLESDQPLVENRLISPSPIKEFLECDLPENDLDLPAPLLESTIAIPPFSLDDVIPEVTSFHRYIYDQTNTLYSSFICCK